jgi:hypothetical protein
VEHQELATMINKTEATRERKRMGIGKGNKRETQRVEQDP